MTSPSSSAISSGLKYKGAAVAALATFQAARFVPRPGLRGSSDGVSNWAEKLSYDLKTQRPSNLPELIDLFAKIILHTGGFQQGSHKSSQPVLDSRSA